MCTHVSVCADLYVCVIHITWCHSHYATIIRNITTSEMVHFIKMRKQGEVAGSGTDCSPSGRQAVIPVETAPAESTSGTCDARTLPLSVPPPQASSQSAAVPRPPFRTTAPLHSHLPPIDTIYSSPYDTGRWHTNLALMLGYVPYPPFDSWPSSLSLASPASPPTSTTCDRLTITAVMYFLFWLLKPSWS